MHQPPENEIPRPGSPAFEARRQKLAAEIRSQDSAGAGLYSGSRFFTMKELSQEINDGTEFGNSWVELSFSLEPEDNVPPEDGEGRNALE